MANLQITIDDGPGPVSVLDQLLSELGKRRVVAAFFVLGEEVHAHPDAARAIHTSGHVLGNHSWNHFIDGARHQTRLFSPEEVYGQFVRTHEEVQRTVHVAMRHWRAPRLEEIGMISSLIAQPARSGGRARLYTLSHCDVHADSRDSQGATTASDMLAALRGTLRERARRDAFRLLFHVNQFTANAFGRVLDGLVADGHRLVDFEQRE